MKNITLKSAGILSILIGFLLSSCVKKDISFQITLSALNLVSKPMSKDGKEKVFAENYSLVNINEEIKKYGGDPAMLKSVKMNKLTVDATSGQNFDKIDYCIASIMKTGMANAKIAYVEGTIPKGTTSLVMANNFTEIADYVKTDTFKMEFRGYNNDSLPPMTFNAKVVLDVTVGPTK